MQIKLLVSIWNETLCWYGQIFGGQIFETGKEKNFQQKMVIGKARFFVILCAISYYLYNLKNMKDTHGGVLLLVSLQAWTFRLFRKIGLVNCHMRTLVFGTGCMVAWFLMVFCYKWIECQTNFFTSFKVNFEGKHYRVLLSKITFRWRYLIRHGIFLLKLDNLL